MIQPLPGIGDMVWHIPHLLAIARHEPEGQVEILTKPRSQSDQLLASLPEVSKVIWLKRKPGEHDGWRGFWRLVQQLRARKLRKVWILHDSSRYALAARLAGIPERVGYAGGWQRWLFSETPRTALSSAGHTVERADRFLAAFDVVLQRPLPLLVPTDAALQQVETVYGGYPRPWFALGIGSSEASRQWGSARFTSCLLALHARYGGTVFLLGGTAEIAMSTALADACRTAAPVPVIQAPLQELIALLTSCQLFVGNDTGMLNLAAATGCHSIALLGQMISAWVATSSPRIHPVYPLGELTTDGVSRITVESVLDTIASLETECDLEQVTGNYSGYNKHRICEPTPKIDPL